MDGPPGWSPTNARPVAVVCRSWSAGLSTVRDTREGAKDSRAGGVEGDHGTMVTVSVNGLPRRTIETSTRLAPRSEV